MTAGSITDNVSERGGGVTNGADGYGFDMEMSMSGVTIRANESSRHGSGISSRGTFVGDDLTIDGNRGASSVANFGDFTLTGSTVTDTASSGQGIGVFTTLDGITRIATTTIHGNAGRGVSSNRRTPTGSIIP